MGDWPWPENETSTGDMRDRLPLSRERLINAVERGRVRIWDKDWNCLVDERASEGDTPSDVIKRAVDKIPDRRVITHTEK